MVWYGINGKHNPVCTYGMRVNIGIIAYWKCLKMVWERLEMLGDFWERLEVSGNVPERLEAVGTFNCVLEHFWGVWERLAGKAGWVSRIPYGIK